MRKITKSPSEKIVKDIKRATRKQYSSEDKIRIVLNGLRGEESIVSFAAVRGFPKVFTTSGLGASWRLANDDWQVARPTLRRLPTAALSATRL